MVGVSFLFIALVCLMGSFLYLGRLKPIPFLVRRREYSIGIFIGENPFNFVAPDDMNNPVLTVDDVTDISAEFVADPFILYENNTWYMFLEVMNAKTWQGEIALATSSDGFHWTYKQVVLDEPFHLSYPYVFKWKNEYYMVPESSEAASVRLYKALDFPIQWTFMGTLLHGKYLDNSILRDEEKWWIFTTPETHPTNNTLHLYYADDLMGPWFEHPRNPVVAGDLKIARSGGRVIVSDGRIIRYSQDGYASYGSQVRAFVVDTLTTTEYREYEVDESPVLKASGTGWNSGGMHQIDPHQIGQNKWIACVDGWKETLVIGRQERLLDRSVNLSRLFKKAKKSISGLAVFSERHQLMKTEQRYKQQGKALPHQKFHSTDEVECERIRTRAHSRSARPSDLLGSPGANRVDGHSLQPVWGYGRRHGS